MTENKAFSAQTSNFSIKNVLARSFFVFRKSPLLFIGLCFLPRFLQNLIKFLTDSSSARGGVTKLAGSIFDILIFIFYVFIHCAIIYNVHELLRGNAARFGKSISIGIARIRFLILAALSLSCLGKILVPIFTLFGFLGLQIAQAIGDSYPLASEIVLAIFTLVLGGIAIMLISKWNMFVPAYVAEHLDPMESFERSSELTKGFRLKIIEIYLLCILFGLPFTSIVSPFSPLKNSIINFFITSLGPMSGRICLSAFVSILVAVPVAFIYIVNTVIYYRLREIKEGVPFDQLNNAFDWTS